MPTKVVAEKNETVDAMVEACRAGPRFARVGRVEVSEHAGAVERGFRVLPSL